MKLTVSKRKAITTTKKDTELPQAILKGNSLVEPLIPKAVDEKQVAYYGALVQGWIGTKMEKDKSLLTLSSFGIGLIGTILTAVGVNSLFEIIVYGIIIVCFLATIISSIIVFDKNADVLKKEISVLCSESNEPTTIKSLKYLDRIMFWSFIIGLIIFLFVGVLSSYNKLSKEDIANESKEQQRTSSNSSNTNQ